jgi:hypothetical protein
MQVNIVLDGRFSRVTSYTDTRQATGEITGGNMPWICLKDQYPEAGKYYLFINGDHLPFVGFWKKDYGATVDGELCRPTHWMPLPEPPVVSNNGFNLTPPVDGAS